MFGQQQIKPLFGTSTGFGATSSTGATFGAAVAPSTSFGGVLFGAKNTFGATTTSAGTGRQKYSVYISKYFEL